MVVPWQGGLRIGILVGLEPLRGGAGLELREAVGVLEREPLLTSAGLMLLERVAVYTCVPLGMVLKDLLPTGLSAELRHEVRAHMILAGEPLDTVWTDAVHVPLARLELYRRQGALEERVSPIPKRVSCLVPLKEGDAALDGAPRANQRRALAHLWDLGSAESAAALARATRVPENAVRALVKKGYIGYAETDAPPASLSAVVPAENTPLTHITLPPSPLLSVSGGSRAARVLALLPLLKETLASGRSALLLAPEQTVLQEAASLLATALPVHILSGETPDPERQTLWTRCRAGEPFVLVGSYLALSAPLELGCVVVLEEASSTYKLTAGCRIFVPTAARFLAEAANVRFALCDALETPETRALVPADGHVSLESGTPRTHLVDLKAGGWPLSADLVLLLKQVAERGRQAILLAPRRGFSAALHCPECEHVIMCPNCDLPLRYHRERYLLRCHQCGHQSRAPDYCPNCSNPGLSPTRAAGTQWIAAEVAKVVPDLTVRRYDSDKREDLSPFMAGEPGVLVATTACLRHPPLPNVSLIGVTLLDAFLSLGDFRSEESAFRLLLNLAELAPERRPLTLVQTFAPESPLLHAFVTGEREHFVTELLGRRELFHYPPYAALAKVQLSARDAASAEHAATWLAGALRTAGATDDELLGPSPAPVARVKRQYSYQLFVRTPLEHLAARLEPALNYRGPARLRIDVDPRDVTGFLE